MIDTTTLVFLFVLMAFLYVGWTYRTNDPNEYHTVARQAGPVRTAATFFTVFGAPHFSIFTTLAIAFGWWSLGFFVGVIVGLIILIALTPRIRSHIPNDVHTFADIAATEVGRTSAKLFSLIGFAFTLSVVASQVVVSAQLLESISEIDYQLAAVTMTACVCGYLYFGGYRSLLYTDVIQACIMFALTVIFAVFMNSYVSSDVDLTSSMAPSSVSPFPFVFFLFLGGVFAASGAPELWQRVLTARTNRIAQVSISGAAVIMLVWGVLVVSAGIAISKIDPGLPAGREFVEFVVNHLPAWMIGLVTMMLLAAMISTADTELFASAVIAQKEFLRARSSGDKQLKIRTTRLLVSVLGVIALVAALANQDLVTILGVITNLGFIMGPLAIAMILGRGGTTRKMRKITFYIGFLLSMTGFGYVWLETGNFFSPWGLLIIGPACIPMLFKGKPEQQVKDGEEFKSE